MQKYYLMDQVLQQNDLELAIEVEDIGVGHLICEKVRFKALFFKHVHANIRLIYLSDIKFYIQTIMVSGFYASSRNIGRAPRLHVRQGILYI